MRRPIVAVIVGSVLLTGAVAGFVLVPEHKPAFTCLGPSIGNVCASPGVTTGWSQTLYDALRIATWALLIVGAVLVVGGLINYARR